MNIRKGKQGKGSERRGVQGIGRTRHKARKEKEGKGRKWKRKGEWSGQSEREKGRERNGKGKKVEEIVRSLEEREVT